MKNKILLLFSAISLSFALDVPIVNNLEMEIPSKQFVIIDFPFQIKKVTLSKFITKKKVIKQKTTNADLLKTNVPVVNIHNPVVKPKNQKTQPRNTKKDTNNGLKIKQGVNTLTIKSKDEGKFEAVIWGYKKYPIIMHFSVIKNNKLPQYFHFIDNQKQITKAEEFEAVPHEKVITALLKSIYNDKTPPGYKLVIGGKDAFQSGGINFVFNRSMVGKKYKIAEYYITNVTNQTIKLYESMFYGVGIYGVSIENNIIKPQKTTRLWIVSKN